MKKLYLIPALLGLIVSGCVRENADNVVADDMPAAEMTYVSIATLAPSVLADMDTRTLLNSDRRVSWCADDAVVGVSFDEPAKLTNAFSEGPVAVFEGLAPDGFLRDTLPMLIYPYRESQDGAVLPKKRMTNLIENIYVVENLVIPARQKLLSGTFDPAANLSIAAVDWNSGEPVRFRNLCMLLNLKLKGTAAVRKIRITGSNELVGTFQMEYDAAATDPAKEFKLVQQGELNGNPERSKTVMLETESEEGIQLTEEPQNFYVPAFVLNANRNMSVKVFVTTTDGDLLALGGGGNISVNGLNVAPGKVAAIGEYAVNGSFFDIDSDFICDRKAREISIAKTKYLTGDYEVSADPAAAWLSVRKTAEGLAVTVEENNTGKARTGAVTIKRGDETLTILNITQQKFGYRDLLGRYMLRNYSSGTTTGSWVLYFKEAEDGQEDHYVVEIAKFMELAAENHRTEFIVRYNAVGKTPLSLQLPQNMLDYDGRKVLLTGATGEKQLMTDDRCGLDLSHTADEYAAGFYFNTNAFAQGTYDNIKYLYISIEGLGEEYIELASDVRAPSLIPITDNLGNGSHEGITPINQTE